MKRAGIPVILTLVFGVFQAANLLAGQTDLPFECICDENASCDIHPMIRALADAHADCECPEEPACDSCKAHPMITALVEAYRRDPHQFSGKDWPVHPMIRAVVESGFTCREEGETCGCCRDPMIRAIVDCWRRSSVPKRPDDESP